MNLAIDGGVLTRFCYYPSIDGIAVAENERIHEAARRSYTRVVVKSRGKDLSLSEGVKQSRGVQSRVMVCGGWLAGWQ